MVRWGSGDGGSGWGGGVVVFSSAHVVQLSSWQLCQDSRSLEGRVGVLMNVSAVESGRCLYICQGCSLICVLENKVCLPSVSPCHCEALLLFKSLILFAYTNELELVCVDHFSVTMRRRGERQPARLSWAFYKPQK